jgi:NADPH2:quinone reductase
MKAIRFHATGEPDVLRYEDVPEPTCDAGQVLVRVRAIGVNFADTRFRRGEYFVRPNFPEVPGMEAAGEVVQVGADVIGMQPGDKVMVLAARAYADLMVAKPYDLYPMPVRLGFDEAASLPVQGLTAHHVLGLVGRVAEGETVLVHAGAGGVGTMAIQLAKAMGAGTVVATVGSAEKADLARSLGADMVVNYRTDDFVPAVKMVTDGKGADVILEMLGGAEMMKRNLACLAPFGRMVVFGAASGDTHATVEPIGLMAKNQTVSGYYLTPILRHRELCAPALDEIAAAVVDKSLRVVVGRTYPLSQAAAAHRDMEERRTTGKIILHPGA